MNMNKNISNGRKEAIKFANRSKGQKKGWIRRREREAKEQASILNHAPTTLQQTNLKSAEVKTPEYKPKHSKVKIPSETLKEITAHADFLYNSYNITLSVTTFVANAIKEKLERIEKNRVRKS